ncbi:RNB domain-containing ribonuclease [Sneathia vaginalis]|uniref:RNB domain-containing ribonuclease n=1 Tax=Sneathia vaginalis TaxID=187101 RepID=UPI00370D93BD
MKLKIGEDNRLCKIELRKRGKAEILIENFMIVANEQVANYMFYNEIPCVYRIHEKPSLESMQALNEQLKDLNYEVKNPKNLIKKLQKIIELTKDTKLGYFIHKMILNSMKKAIYSKDNKGHFGLSLKNYLHFTSPIRRYSDLMVHRILLESMDKYMSEFKKERINKKLNTICKIISNNERRAQKMEYLARDIKLTEYMMKNLGKKYKAMVTSINNDRCFVNLENYIEAELLDDIKAHLGENLEVMVVGTDMLKGKIYVKRLVNGNSKK